MTALETNANQLYTSLQATDGIWITRRQLAKLINRKRIQTVDTLALDFLQIQGLVEVRATPIKGGIGRLYEYRVKREALAEAV